MSDLISRAELPSAEPPTGELISKADAIELLMEILFDEPPYFDSETLCRLYAEEQINTLPSAEIAETEPIAIRSKTLLPTKDFKEWAKRIREVNPNAVVIPCDAEVASAEAVDVYKAHEEEHLKIVERIKELQYAIAKTQTIVGKVVESAEAEWIPCSKRLPENTAEWKAYITCNDTGLVTTTFWADGWNCLRNPDGEIGREHELKNIVAWMPLPEPWKGADDEEV